MDRIRWRAVAGYATAWLVLAAGLTVAFFLSSSVSTTVVSHDAVVRPTVDGWVTLHTGPYLPDVRAPSESPVGVDITLGKTKVASTDQLVDRYAFIASQPDAQVLRVEGALRSMAYDAALRGAVVAVVPLVVWALVGPDRRRDLARRAWSHKAVAAGVTAAALALGVLAWEPWEEDDPMLVDGNWQRLDRYLPEVDLPDEAAGIEITRNPTTSASKRLILSAIDTYEESKEFYREAAERAAFLAVRPPREGETVALLISDRHDNIGMDPVARAIADAAGATAVLDAGDDTSTGEEWETFSLDSLAETYEDLDRYAVTGNHDHGGFVGTYLGERGWEVGDGIVDGPGGSVLMAVDDPRSSGLGNWRDEPGLSIGELAVIIADEACASEERVNTLLVHDSDLGTDALERGCVDLVVSGHTHVRSGPDPVLGSNGQTGYAYTTGTAGGAAYALAVGSKLRRAAEVGLITYRDGRPVGIQWVGLQTNGVFEVGVWVPLTGLHG